MSEIIRKAVVGDAVITAFLWEGPQRWYITLKKQGSEEVGWPEQNTLYQGQLRLKQIKQIMQWLREYRCEDSRELRSFLVSLFKLQQQLDLRVLTHYLGEQEIPVPETELPMIPIPTDEEYAPVRGARWYMNHGLSTRAANQLAKKSITPATLKQMSYEEIISIREVAEVLANEIYRFQQRLYYPRNGEE